MSDEITKFSNWYKAILLRQNYPNSSAVVGIDLFETLLSREEKKFLGEKKMQILTIIHALGTVSVFKQIPDPPQSEIEKVIASIKRARDIDPDLFIRYSDSEYVRDALEFLKKHQD